MRCACGVACGFRASLCVYCRDHRDKVREAQDYTPQRRVTVEDQLRRIDAQKRRRAA